MKKDKYKKLLLLTSVLVLSSIPNNAKAVENDSNTTSVESLDTKSNLEDLDSYSLWVKEVSNSLNEKEDIGLNSNLLIQLTSELFTEFNLQNKVNEVEETFNTLLIGEVEKLTEDTYIIEELTAILVNHTNSEQVEMKEEVETSEESFNEEDSEVVDEGVSEESLDQLHAEESKEVKISDESDKKAEPELKEPLSLRTTRAVVSKESDSELAKLISESKTGGASSRWHAAIKGYSLYPTEKEFQEQLKFLSGRMLTLGIQEYNTQNYKGALVYFERIVDGPKELFSSELNNKANEYMSELRIVVNPLNSLENLLVQSKSGGASSRWHAAELGYRLYPNELEFQDQLRFLATRMMTFGKGEHEKSNFSGALTYYNRIVNGPSELLDTALVNEASSLLDDAEKGIRLVSKEELITESSSGSASSRWHAAELGYRLYPEETEFHDQLRFLATRMLRFGKEQHEKGNFSGALIYYNRIVNGPTELLDNDLIRETSILQNDAENNVRLVAKETLMNQARSGGASSRWHAALEGYRLYPREVEFQDQLKFLSNRMMTFGKAEHEKGNFSSALSYYDRIISAPSGLFDTDLIREALTLQKDAENGIRLVSKETLIKQSRNGSASVRWNTSLEGYRLYPDEVHFHQQLRYLSGRMVSLGTAQHENGKFDNALLYYNRVINGPIELLDNTIVNNAEVYKNQAEQKQRILTKDEVMRNATTGGASARFNASLEGYKWFSSDSEVVELVRTTSNRLFNLGLQHHDKGEFEAALTYYNRLAVLDETFNSLQSQVRTNRYFAKNNLYLVNSIYYSSTYSLSLDNMLNEQMKRNPQTDLYGNGWQSAKLPDVRYYVDPKNFVGDLINGTVENRQLQIATSSLNVRSNPSTNGTVLGQVLRNQIYDILSFQNGWYQIAYGQSNGWISAAYVSLISAPKEFEMNSVNGIVTASSLRVRTSPSTNSAIVTNVTQGDQLSILGERADWLNIRIGNITGWVHRDYVRLETFINRYALQFLVLSGSSGVKASDLNQELVGKGILANQGVSFVTASQMYNINEIYLMSHALLETGNGTSELARGVKVNEVDGVKVPEKVVYNMYGIGAYDNSALKSGSEYAYKQGWDTPEKAIIGGAEWISRQYINHSTYRQDTLYKMRWNPATPGMHQYATDIGWAYKQTRSLDSIVEMSQKYNFVLRFDIPNYLN